MQVTEGHIFGRMSFRDVEDTDERLVLERDTGLDAGLVREQVSAYQQRYGVPDEPLK